MIPFLSIASFFIISIYFYNKGRKKSAWKFPKTSFPITWRALLKKNVSFYNSLSTKEKEKFEYRLQEFILNYKIIGVKTSIDINDISAQNKLIAEGEDDSDDIDRHVSEWIEANRVDYDSWLAAARQAAQ